MYKLHADTVVENLRLEQIFLSFQPRQELRHQAHHPATGVGRRFQDIKNLMATEAKVEAKVYRTQQAVRVRAESKPIRVIKEELEKKLQILRTNTTEWELLRVRVGMFFLM